MARTLTSSATEQPGYGRSSVTQAGVPGLPGLSRDQPPKLHHLVEVLFAGGGGGGDVHDAQREG